MRKNVDSVVKRVLLAACVVLWTVEGWAVNEMAKGLKFSTHGNDSWLDESATNAVAAGECYALVWKQKGATFAGLPTVPPNPNDVYALGEEVWLVDYFPVAALDDETGRMRCPEQIIGIGKLPSWEAKNGTWTVYLLDTRYWRSDGTIACGFDKAVTNAPRRINAFAAVPGLTDFTIGTTLGPAWVIQTGGYADGSPVVADMATEPKVGTVTFDARGGTCEAEPRIRTYGDDYGELPTATRKGYAFVGWFTAPEGGTEIFADSPTDGDRTLFAQWENNRYAVHFDPAGGHGEMPDAEFAYDVGERLPPCGFTRTDAVFVCWMREPGGSKAFLDEAEVLNLTDVAGDVVRLRAVWAFLEGTVSEMLTDGAWTSGSTSETGAAVRQGDATHAELSTAHLSTDGPGEVWIETTVTNATRLVFEWKTSGVLALSVDGETVRTLEGPTNWTEDVVVEIARDGLHAVRWTFVAADGDGTGGDAWVSNVRLHPGVHVLFDGNGAAFWTVPASLQVYEGDSFTLPEQGEMRRWGCEFLGWEVGGETLQPGTELKARREDVLCKALWTQGEILPELDYWYDSDEAVWEILSVAEDWKLRAYVVDIWTYNRFRVWALAALTADGTAVAGAEVVLASPHAWVSFALDSERLLTRAPTDEDLEIERFGPCAEGLGRFDFTIRVQGVTIGSSAWSDELSRVFGVKGAETLVPGAFTSEGVWVESYWSEDGVLRFMAGPDDPSQPTFFMRPFVLP